jgi:type I restriction enzyme S subunit
MVEGWEEVRIRDLGKIVTGNTPPRKSPELYGKHTIFVKPTDINKGEKYCYNPEECYSEKGFDKYKKSLIPKGATCVVTIGSIGEKMIKAHTDLFINQAVNAIIPYDNFDEDFIYYLLKFNLFQLKTFDSGTASGRENVSKSSFSNIKVRVPKDRIVQNRIGVVLSAYDDLIENNLRRIKLLEEQAQLMYEEWFVRMRFPGFEELGVDEETGLPVGWEIKTLKEVGEVITGKTPSTRNKEFYGQDIPFIKTPDMAKFPYVIETNQSLSNKGAESQKKKYLPKNSIVISCIGSAGAYALVSKPSQTNQQINAIKFKKDIYPFFVYCFSKGLKDVLEALGSNGATMTNVNKSKFENIEIAIPEEKLLTTFHRRIEGNFTEILNLQKQNILLQEARDIMLPRLMVGLVDVENI